MRQRSMLAILSISLLLSALDTTVLNVALPSISAGLSASPHQLQWIVDAYVLVYGSLLLTAGRFADRFGRRKLMIAGLALFAIASVFAAFAHSLWLLITMRALMGVGGATLTPTTLAIVRDQYRDPSERGVAIAVWSAALGLGVAIGPLVGGVLLQHFWWGSAFLVNVPIAAVAIVGAVLVVPESADPAAPPLDLPGVLLSLAGLGVTLAGVIEAPRVGWTSTQTIVLLAAGVLLLGCFVLVEARAEHPMLTLGLYRNPGFAPASVVSLTSFFAVFAVLYVATLFLQSVRGESPLGAGLRILPAAATIIVAAPLSEPVSRRIGAEATAAIGMGLLAFGCAWMAFTPAASGYGHLIIALGPIGVGFGFALAPIVDRVLASLPTERAAVGSAANSTAQQVGGALGIAIVGSILASVADQRLATRLDAHLGHLTFSTARVASGQLAPDDARKVLSALRNGFRAGMHPALLVAAGVCLLGAAVILGAPARDSTGVGETA